jgi:hypothetical protein
VKADRRDLLPCDPIGLSRVEAAAYIGVSATKFDQLVGDGRMPRPKRIDGRVVWDREVLRLTFKALPDDGEAVARPSALDRARV